MRLLRWQWIIGLVGLALTGAATGQEGEAKGSNTNETETEIETETKPVLTGIPQIDYIHDPNLPIEVRAYDLSEYPFYNRLPEDLILPSFNFTCDDRHDGFYASVVHKCQVYHNCIFGTRYDFLCANYTVFDQKNFICHYVSEVDCPNSEKHYDRNNELYETTTTTRAPPQIIYVDRPRPSRGPRPNRPNKLPRPFGGIRRPVNRRTTTTTPAPAYYDDYDYYQYYDDQYYDYYYDEYANEQTTTTTTTTTTQRPRRPNRPQRKRFGGEGGTRSRPPGRFGNVFNVKDRKRPRINPPVPIDDETSGQRPRASRLQQSSARQQAVDETPQDNGQDGPSSGPRRRRPGRKPGPGGRQPKKTTTTTTTTEAVPEEDYYYDDYYADEPTTTEAPTRLSPSRTRGRGSQREQQRSRLAQTTTTTEEAPTEGPRSRPSRPSRLNARNSPASSRRTPVVGAVPLDGSQEPEPSQDTAQPQRQRPQRLRPQFPRNRPESESPVSGGEETEIVEEASPLDPGLELNPDESPVNAANNSGTTGGLSRTPIRRLGNRPARRGLGQRGGQQAPPAPDYDY